MLKRSKAVMKYPDTDEGLLTNPKGESMRKGKKPVLFLTLLFFLIVGSFIYACQGEGKYADINIQEVIGQVELPRLPDADQAGDEPIYQEAGASQTQASSLKPLPDEISTNLPDFTKYRNVKKKKTAFFNFLRPIVRRENREVLRQRAYVLIQWQRFKRGEQLREDAVEHLRELAGTYRVDSRYSEGGAFFRELLIHIDKIPVSLALI